MKKILLSLLFISITAIVLNFTPVAVQAGTTTRLTVKTQVKAKPIVKAKTKVKPKTKTVAAKSKIKTTLKWDASALKFLNNMAFFDYSTIVRNAYIKKVENYARRNKIKAVTIKVINSMRE